MTAYRTVTSAEAADWLVLVHGATQHSGLFDAQERWFAGRWNLLLVDLPGHGRSAALAGPFGIVEYAAAVREAIAGAGIEQFHFWGTHSGAAVGLALAAERPAIVRSLILEGALLPGQPLPYVDQAIAQARSIAREQGVAAARRWWFDTAEFFDLIRTDPIACRAAAHWDIISSFGGAPWTCPKPPAALDLSARLKDIAAPTLFVNGASDVPDFQEAAEMLAKQIPNSERVIISDAGGFPLWERPSIVNPIIDAWLGRHGGRATGEAVVETG